MAEEKRQKRKRNAAINQMECVACGSCVTVCPRSAIQVLKGVYAAIDIHACIGCEKCMIACPACVIALSEEAG